MIKILTDYDRLRRTHAALEGARKAYREARSAKDPDGLALARRALERARLDYHQARRYPAAAVALAGGVQ